MIETIGCKWPILIVIQFLLYEPVPRGRPSGPAGAEKAEPRPSAAARAAAMRSFVMVCLLYVLEGSQISPRSTTERAERSHWRPKSLNSFEMDQRIARNKTRLTRCTVSIQGS